MHPSTQPYLLIAAGDAQLRELLSETLGNAGFAVAAAEDGVAALETCREQLPLLALLDLNLPGMEGCAFCQSLRHLPDGDLLPIIMLTAVADDATIQRAFEAGATDFIPIPFQPQILVQRIRCLLRNATAIRELASSREQMLHSKQAAEAAVRAKAEFLANMSHELRTPLNGLLGMLQLLQTTALDEEQQEYIDLAVFSGSSLLTVINDVLEFSKLEAGKLIPASVEMEPRKLLENIATIFTPQAASKGVLLDWSIDPTLPAQLYSDPGRLRQILFNLVGNAVKFTDEGQILIRAEGGCDTSTTPLLRLVVRDTGIGIDPELRPRLFEPFTQGDGSYTRRHQGTGLGLAIVAKLLQHLGGEIDIASAPGQGTTVTVTLPVTLPIVKPAAEQPVPALAVARNEGLNVLVVEDNHVNRLLLQRQLEKLGHRAICAEGGDEALTLLESMTPDAVLLDIQMPQMGGLEVTRRLRENSHGRFPADLPLIAITAHAMPGDRDRFLAAGLNAYLSKPIRLEELNRVLSSCAMPPAKELDSRSASV